MADINRDIEILKGIAKYCDRIRLAQERLAIHTRFFNLTTSIRVLALCTLFKSASLQPA